MAPRKASFNRYRRPPLVDSDRCQFRDARHGSPGKLTGAPRGHKFFRDRGGLTDRARMRTLGARATEAEASTRAN